MKNIKRINFRITISGLSKKKIVENIGLFSTFFNINNERINTSMIKFYNTLIKTLGYDKNYPEEMIPFYILKDVRISY